MLSRKLCSSAAKLPGDPAGITHSAADTPQDAERRLQATLDEVRRAWERVPASLFGGEQERSRVHEAFVGAGVFRALTGARHAGQSVDACAALALLAPEVRAVRGYRPILQAWIVPLRAAALRPSGRPAEESDAIWEQGEGTSRAPRTRPGSFARVCAQQQAIIDALRKGNVGRAREMIEDLCADQAGSKPIYLAKSLCLLAAEAHRCGLRDLPDELTDRATRVCPGDAWAWSQRGVALRRAGDLQGARLAHERALTLGDHVAARNGRADVLKDMGHLDDALQTFEETLREHPESLFAQHGRATVLRVMGRLRDALDAYDTMLLHDPRDVFAKTGRAAIFKMEGRLEDALSAYDAAVHEHPEDVVARTGRADVLRLLGRRAEALAGYDAILCEHPHNTVARRGRAGVQRAPRLAPRRAA